MTERSSAVRGCRAALSHRVQTVCCLSSCCTLLFSFFLHIHLIADFHFVDALLFIIRAFSSWFLSLLPYLISPILARPFLDTIKPAGAPACSAGEWGWRPFGPRASVLIWCFHACILICVPIFLAFCILVFVLALHLQFVLAFFPEFARCFVLFWSSMTFFITFCLALSIVFRDSLVPVRAPVCQAGFYQAWASRPVSPG